MSNLDSLAELATTTMLDEAELAARLGVHNRTVAGWIAGTLRPTEPERLALRKLVSDARERHERRTASFRMARDHAFGRLLVALQSPDERRQWLASRERMRAQFAPAM